MKAASTDDASTDTPTQALVLLLGLKRWSNILNKSCNVARWITVDCERIYSSSHTVFPRQLPSVSTSTEARLLEKTERENASGVFYQSSRISTLQYQAQHCEFWRGDMIHIHITIEKGSGTSWRQPSRDHAFASRLGPLSAWRPNFVWFGTVWVSPENRPICVLVLVHLHLASGWLRPLKSELDLPRAG